MNTNTMSISTISVAAVWLVFFGAPIVSASEPAQWHFNYDLGDVDEGGFSDIDGYSPPPTAGSGTSLLIGGVEPRFEGGDYAIGFNDGWHGDAHGGEGDEGNYGWQTFEYPEQGTGDGTAGTQFNVSTVGYSNITISYAHRFSGRSSRHAALEYTLDGGFTWQRAYEYEAVNGHDLWYFQRFDFSDILEANDNPDFGFRIVAIFMPGADPAGYEDANNNRPGVLFDNNGYRPSGTWRFDMVGVYAGHPSVRINEFMGRNHVFLPDEDGDYESWLELYNTSDQPINLNGYGLSDDYDNHFRWVIPDVTIAPDGFLVIFCSNKDRTSGELHTNFSISAGGEELFITHPDGWRVDEIPPYELGTNISLGRQQDGWPHLVYFAEATPGASNTTDGFEHGPIDPPTFSHAPGFYTDGLLLELETDDPEATIYYTLDGSTPTTESNVYAGPIQIDSREGEPNLFSMIPTNAIASGNNAWQPPASEVFKVTPIRARAIRANALPSSVMTRTYLIDPQIDSRYTVNVISINTDAENFFDDEIGIYVPGVHYDNDQGTGNYYERGIEWERPVHIELFEQDGTLGFAQDAGARIHGGFSRRLPQKTLRLYARNAYGNSHFKYPIFPDKEDDAYRRFLLRNSGNDWRLTTFRDSMMQTLVHDDGFDTQATRPTVVFLNGEFWGIHHIRERYDVHYLERVHGADPDNVDLLSGRTARVIAGSNEHYLAMLDYMENHDLSDPEHYAAIQSMMDTDDYIAYFAAQIYIGNSDWPNNNNDYWRPKSPDGIWRRLMYDIDRGFGLLNSEDEATDSLNRVVNELDGAGAFPFQRLLTNEEFRRDFINRYADMMNTSFLPSRAIEVIDWYDGHFSPMMPEVISRWVNYGTFNLWSNRVQGLRNFATNRPMHARQHVVDVFNLPGQAELTFDNPTPDRGSIHVNTVDPDNYGGVPWTGVYFQSVPLPLYATPEAGYRFAGWEGIPESNGQETFLYVPDVDATLTAKFDNQADLNGDGAVDGLDLLILLSGWGTCADPDNCLGDINGDGAVDGLDLLILLSNWG